MQQASLGTVAGDKNSCCDALVLQLQLAGGALPALAAVPRCRRPVTWTGAVAGAKLA